MSESTSDNNSVLLVHAYLDDELDAAKALGIAERMSAEPALASPCSAPADRDTEGEVS
jgi:hypothetical protein